MRVCSASAPVVDSLYLGAAPKLGFLQTNPGQAMETREQGGVAPCAYRSSVKR